MSKIRFLFCLSIPDIALNVTTTGYDVINKHIKLRAMNNRVFVRRFVFRYFRTVSPCSTACTPTYITSVEKNWRKIIASLCEMSSYNLKLYRVRVL